jgi:hypothetical protein
MPLDFWHWKQLEEEGHILPSAESPWEIVFVQLSWLFSINLMVLILPLLLLLLMTLTIRMLKPLLALVISLLASLPIFLYFVYNNILTHKICIPYH